MGGLSPRHLRRFSGQWGAAVMARKQSSKLKVTSTNYAQVVHWLHCSRYTFKYRWAEEQIREGQTIPRELRDGH